MSADLRTPEQLEADEARARRKVGVRARLDVAVVPGMSVADALDRLANVDRDALRALVAEGVRRALRVERSADRWLVSEMTAEGIAREVVP